MRIVPLLHGTIHGVHYIRVYWWNVSISICQRPWELFPFSLALFTVFITYMYTDIMYPLVYSRDYWIRSPFSLALFTMFIIYEYTNRICPSVYSKVYKNYSLNNALIINVLLTVEFFPNNITGRMKSHWWYFERLSKNFRESHKFPFDLPIKWKFISNSICKN
jgi:hypothetical protein